MRITLAINSLARGGAEKNLSIMANHWAMQGDTITILTFDEGTSAPAYTLRPEIKHTPLNISCSSKSTLQKVFTLMRLPFVLRKAIKSSNPDVLISFMDQTNMLCLIAACNLSFPIIVAERVNPAKSSILEPQMPALLRRILAPLRNFLYRWAANIVVQTEDAANYFPIYLSQRVVAIPNPVLPPEAQESIPLAIATNPKHPSEQQPAGTKKEANTPGTYADITLQSPCIIAMGRLVPQKRFDLLINSFARITQAHPEWSLAIIGAGAELNKLKELARELGVSQKVFLPGPTANAHAVLKQAQIFVLSSDYEGFPNALCDAMACGLPVIATDCDYGPRTIIRNSFDGILVPTDNAEALAQALEELLRFPHKRVALSEQAPAVVQRFSLEYIMMRWEKLIAACDHSR